MTYSGFKNSKMTKMFAVALGLVIAIGFLPVQAQAEGPEFNIFPISYSGEENHDFPLLDARNYSENGSFSQSQTDHDNGVYADPGDIVEFIIYYHNGAPDAPENVAENVRIRAFLPSGKSQTHRVSAQISASNAATVYSSSLGGDIDVHINGSEPQTLEYIPGSTRWYPERSSSYQVLPDGIVSGGVDIGDIRGCWDFSGFIKFRARVGEEAPAQGRLQIEKMVSNLSVGGSFRDRADADPADIVKFRIEVQALDADVENVIIRDILPSGLDFEEGTLQVNGSLRSGSQGLFGSGYDYGTLFEGEDVEIAFEAKVASASFFDGQSRTLTNTANARGRDVATVQDTARIDVSGQVLGSSFRLSKSAFNQTKGINAQSVLADAGDIINYTLTYENTGEVTARNVVIEDDISDVLQLADLINDGGGTLIGGTIRFPAITVSPGVSVSKTFQVRVRPVEFGASDLTMTNIYGNQVDVQVRPPLVKGTYIAPKTGPAENVVLILSLLTTAAFYLRRKYPKLKAKLTA